MTKAKRYWAWRVSTGILGEGDTLGPWLYEKRPRHDERTRAVKAKLIRVQLSEVEPVCGTGCGMIEDQPVFCRRHAPKARSKT